MMRQRERGMTFLGWIVILVPVALVLYAGLRLTPIYLEYMKVARTLESVKEQFQGETIEPRALRIAVERRFDIEDVTAIGKDEIRITKEGAGYTIEAAYSATAPLLANVYLLVDFDKVVTVE